jgi:serine/threonine protein kinase
VSSVQYLIGKTLAKYQILEHIGHGGMSEVYKGQQAQLNRMIAVKVLHPFLADEDGFVVRFQREARLVAALRHPNIVQVYDFDYNDELGIYYMVMEYIDGRTLKDLMEQGPISPEDTIHVGSAIAEALDYAHQHGMVHRDIKPANIMYLNDKEPVLTDFGIARMLTLSGLTASGAMVGTPAYMAPEIGLGKAGAAASDIYSLSVVLYHAVTGTLPFASETPMGMVMDHINKPPPLPSIFAPNLPKALEQVILRGMEKDAGARFRSAAEMAAALRKILNPIEIPLTAVSSPPSGHNTQPTGEIAPVTEAHIERPRRNGQERLERDPREVGGQSQTAGLEADDDWLIKSWPAATSMEDAAGAAAAEDSSPQEAQPRSTLQRLLRAPLAWLLLVLVTGLTGIGIWYGLGGDMRASPIALRTVDAVGAITDGHTPATVVLPTAIATGPGRASHPSAARPSSAAIPGPTVAPDCLPRGRVERVSIEPSPRIAPQTTLMAYVTLRNYGPCTWPAGTELHLSGDALIELPKSLAVKTLEPGEIMHLLIPLTAPEESGAYQTSVEMRTATGGRFGSPVKVDILVEDLPQQILTPAVSVTTEPTTLPPLIMKTPLVVRWEDQPAQDRWTGLVELAAEGSSGAYRYYHDKIRADTEIVDGRIVVVGRRCESVTLSLWILSGNQNVYWQGKVPFPAPEQCW